MGLLGLTEELVYEKILARKNPLTSNLGQRHLPGHLKSFLLTAEHL